MNHIKEEADALVERRAASRVPTFIPCNPMRSDSEFETTDFSVTYQVQTSMPLETLASTSDDDFVNSLPRLVQGAALELIHYTICEIGNRSRGGRQPVSISRLANCVFNFEAVNVDELMYCRDESLENCVAFHGGIRVHHTSDCRNEIEFACLIALEVGTYSETFAESINNRVEDGYSNAVTTVRIVEDSEAVHASGGEKEEDVGISAISTQQDSAAVNQNDGSITAGGFVVISLASLFLVLFIALLFVWGKRRRDQSRSLEDGKSVKTDASDAQGSYETADFNAMDKGNSKTNVHLCTSATCPVCLSNPDGVHMVTVPKGQNGPVPVSYKDYEAREESFEATYNGSPLSTPSRNPLRRLLGRKNKATHNLAYVESVSFVQVASNINHDSSMANEDSNKASETYS